MWNAGPFATAFFIVSVASVSNPVQVQWSGTTYGPDGPWNAVTVNVGSQPQKVDLIPGGTYGNLFLSPNVCFNDTLGQQYTGSSCPARMAGVYDANSSLTVVDGWNSRLVISPDFSFGPPINQGGTGQQVLDLFGADGVTDLDPIYNVSHIVADLAWRTLPSGRRYPLSVGLFSLGMADVNHTFTVRNPDDYDINGTTLVTGLYRYGIIPSASIGLHIGAATVGMPGSMILGGYDTNRIYGRVTSELFRPVHSSEQPEFQIALQDIGISSVGNGTPFSYRNRSGILAEGNSSIARSQFSVGIDHSYPYMALPPSVCTALTKDLPVHFSQDLGLYLWNVQDPAYAKIINSASFLTFTFLTSDHSNLTINAPWALFNLTLSSPIVDSPIPYFPCAPLNSSAGQNTYTLGRAFLQAAYFGISWQPGTSNGRWLLAQGAGPKNPVTASINPFSNVTTGITGYRDHWEDTLSGIWNTDTADASPTAPSASSSPPPPLPTLSPTSSSSSRSTLSSGAIGGIVVGVIVAVAATGIAIWGLSRRRSQEILKSETAKDTQGIAKTDHKSTYEAKELPSEPPLYEMVGSSSDPTYEMPAEEHQINRRPVANHGGE